MLYNVKKVDNDIFKSSIDHVGREVINYYTGQTEKVLVEPNSTLEGGKIYCRSDSWIQRGDIIKVSGEWYVVMQLSNLASDVYNVGVISKCDVALRLRLGKFVYEVPAVASKYSGNSNVRGVIDDSIDGQLSFITGYHEEFDELDDNPCVTVFGKVWQIGNYMNVNKVMTVYCQGVTNAIAVELCVEKIPDTVRVGEEIDLKIHVLNTASMTVPSDIKITLSGTNSGTVDGNKIKFTKTGTYSFTITSKTLGVYYTSPDIKVI